MEAMDPNGQLKLLTEAVAELSGQERQRVRECMDKIGALLATYGSAGVMALAIVGASLAAEAERE